MDDVLGSIMAWAFGGAVWAMVSGVLAIVVSTVKSEKGDWHSWLIFTGVAFAVVFVGGFLVFASLSITWQLFGQAWMDQVLYG